ncbi:MAG: GDP-mannose 4,6-dehydratase, partial [Candidatus Lindowbacteria bacterium]|nr:GDP-mannose 4,6-dehydratase [Candidatus Lindowbacteria bacterium]
KQNPWVQFCSTSEVYGQVSPEDIPIKEDLVFRHASSYAVLKITQDMLGHSYFASYKMNIIRTRMFAYLNPRRGDLFATSFAMQVARIEVGLQETLTHGNLESVRTLIDVRDAMEAYWVALEKCEAGEAYNIGGNTTISVGEFLEILKTLSTTKIPSKQDPKLLRPSDVTLQVPDTSKFEAATGWKPKYSFEQSIEFLLEHCRSRAQQEKLLKDN